MPNLRNGQNRAGTAYIPMSSGRVHKIDGSRQADVDRNWRNLKKFLYGTGRKITNVDTSGMQIFVKTTNHFLQPRAMLLRICLAALRLKATFSTRSWKAWPKRSATSCRVTGMDPPLSHSRFVSEEQLKSRLLDTGIRKGFLEGAKSGYRGSRSGMEGAADAGPPFWREHKRQE